MLHQAEADEQAVVRREYIVELEDMPEPTRSWYLDLLKRDLQPISDQLTVTSAGVLVALEARDAISPADIGADCIYGLDQKLRDRFQQVVESIGAGRFGRDGSRVERVYERWLDAVTNEELRAGGDDFTAFYRKYLQDQTEPFRSRRNASLGQALEVWAKAYLTREHPEWTEHFKSVERARAAVPTLPADFRGGAREPVWDEPATTLTSIPISAQSARAAADAARRERLLRTALSSRFTGRTTEVISALTSTVAGRQLQLGSPGRVALDATLAVLDIPRGRRTRNVDSWPVHWAPYAGGGVLVMILLAMIMAWWPVGYISGVIAALCVLTVTTGATLAGRHKGASPMRVSLGMSPILIVWIFAIIYAVTGWIAWPTDPVAWVHPLLLSLSIATTVGYLDYEVGAVVTVRLVTMVEMLLVVSILGGSVVGAFRSIMEGLRDKRSTTD